MKKLVLATLILILAISMAIDAATTQSQQDAALKALVKKTDRQEAAIKALVEKIDHAEAALKVLVPEYDKIKAELKRKKSEADHDVQAQRTANRALAWAIRRSVGDAQGHHPEIEAIERMLAPIERGDMRPLPFEKAVAKDLKKRGWKVVEKPTVVESPKVDFDRYLLKSEAEKKYATKDELKIMKREVLDGIPSTQETIETLRKKGYRTETELRQIFSTKKEVSSLRDDLTKVEENAQAAEQKAAGAQITARLAQDKATKAAELASANSRTVAIVSSQKARSQFISYCYELWKLRYSLKDFGISPRQVLQAHFLGPDQKTPDLVQELSKGFQKIDPTLDRVAAKAAARKVLGLN